MKRILLLTTLIVLSCALAPAQTTRTGASAEGRNSTSVGAGDRLEIASGTRLAAQLQQTLDVRKARLGDEVVLKTAEAIKSNGRTVVKKGAKLFGRVTEVRQSAEGSAESRIGLVFDRLESGSISTPISATITAVTQARSRARADDGGLGAESDVRGGAAAGGGSGGGGGLLGGVGNTVGGVAGGVTNTVGGVASTTTGAVGQTVGAAGGAVGNVGRTVRGLRVTQSAGAEASGSSTLSLAGGNLKLEKNTTFHLVVGGSAGVNDDR